MSAKYIVSKNKQHIIEEVAKKIAMVCMWSYGLWMFSLWEIKWEIIENDRKFSPTTDPTLSISEYTKYL